MSYEEFEKAKQESYDKVKIRQLLNFESQEADIKVSVVIPIFNVEDYLPQCLDSVISQSLKDIEVICVNDGSTDNSLEILMEYLAKDNRIKIIDKDNAGYGHTMNIGMDMANGEYIVIVESDDWILPDMLKTLYETASENDLDFVKSDYYRFFGEEPNIFKSYFQIDETDTFYNKLISTKTLHESYTMQMNTWTGLYKTDFLRKNCIRHFETPGASYQDNGFWFKTFYYGERAMFLPEAFYMYRRDNPNSSVKNKEKVYAMDNEYELIHNFLEQQDDISNFRDVYTYAKYHNFHFTMNRIDLEFKKEFLFHTAENFRQMQLNDEFDPSLLREQDRITLNNIMNNTEGYYHHMYTINDDNIDYFMKYLECRVDIKNHGDVGNDILITQYNDNLLRIVQPRWFKDETGTGTSIQSINGVLDISFKCINDGNLLFEFKSIDYRDRGGNRIPVLIDYTEITVDDENIVTGSAIAWHNKPFTFSKDVKDGQIVKLHFTWKPLNRDSDVQFQENVVKVSAVDVINLINEVNYLKNENVALKKFKKDLLSSKSWKLTEPLRRIKQ